MRSKLIQRAPGMAVIFVLLLGCTALAAEDSTPAAPATASNDAEDNTSSDATPPTATSSATTATTADTAPPVKTEAAKPAKPSGDSAVNKEKKITLHFPDTDIRLALETISAKVGVGIIAGPDVKGKISIKLEDVPWEKGLDILLKTYGFSYVWEEGLIRVMSRKEMSEMGMQTQVFKVQYADVLEVEKSLKVIASKDGVVQSSKETKTIIVKDTPDNLKNIDAFIKKLDRMAAEGKQGGAEEETALSESAEPKAGDQAGQTKKKKSLVLDFKELPIRDAVAQISALSGVYISLGEEVKAVVTLSTGGKEVPWQKALKEIISASDLAYEPADMAIDNLKAGDFIRIRTKEKILEKIEKDEKIKERVDVEHVVIQLKYVDAIDIQKILETQLTARGKITILETSGQTGWKFASEDKSATLQVQARAAEAKPAKSRTLLLSDIPTSVQKMLKIIESIDLMPYQIVIETKFVEASVDFLKDHGFDIATGSAGLDSATITQVPLAREFDNAKTTVTGGSKFMDNGVAPKNFIPVTANIGNTNAGAIFSVKHLFNTQYDAFFRMIQEDVTSNVLSAPKVMTLNNQEATIVIGTKFPIVTTTTTTGASSTTTVDLKYYQDIGVRMNVIPQVSDNRYINMILHPSITSQNGSVTVFNTGGFQIASYPILTTREAETQVLMKDGETVVLGGLIEDRKSDSIIGIPILNNIPILGPLFTRNTIKTNKIDLLIFITAYLVHKGNPRTDFEIRNNASVPVSSAIAAATPTAVSGAAESADAEGPAAPETSTAPEPVAPIGNMKMTSTTAQ